MNTQPYFFRTLVFALAWGPLGAAWAQTGESTPPALTAPAQEPVTAPPSEAVTAQPQESAALPASNPSPLPPSEQPQVRSDGWNPCPESLAEDGGTAPAQSQQWTFTAAPFIFHWSYDPKQSYAFAFALERSVTQQRFCGLSLFRNSFGQPSAYLYAGHRWDNLWGQPRWAAKLTVGVIYGYVGEHRDKVPFNWNGYSPTVIPTLIYQFNPQDSLDVSLLGTAGVVFGFTRRF